MSLKEDTRNLIGQQQLLLAAQSEHAAAVWFGRDDLISDARERAHHRLDAVLDAQENQIIGAMNRNP